MSAESDNVQLVQQILYETALTPDSLHTRLNSALGAPQVIDLAASHSQPSLLCAKLFRKSEPAYCCYTCGVDPTCIQCMDCFKDSDHSGHDIRMTRSGGGGCCDCGDTSSWDPKGACTRHKPQEQVSSKSSQDCRVILASHFDTAFKLISDVVKLLSSALISANDCHLFMGVSSKHLKQCRATLLQGSAEFTVLKLINDDTISFQRAINGITKVVKCSSSISRVIAVRTDLLLESPVYLVPQGEFSLEDMQRAFASLKTVVNHQHIRGFVSGQEFWLMIDWLVSLCHVSDVFRVLISEAFASSLEAAETPFVFRKYIGQLNLLDGFCVCAPSFSARMWRSFEDLCFQLMQSMDFKEQMARSLLKWLPDLLVNNDHLGDSKQSFLGFAVQLFTIPPLVIKFLQQSGSILENHIQAFLQIADNVTLNDGRMNGSIPNSLFLVEHHIDFILSCPGVPEELVINPQFTRILRKWAEGLVNYEGMDLQTRVSSGMHVQYESDTWQNSFLLSMELMQISQHFSKLTRRCLSVSDALGKKHELGLQLKELLEDIARFVPQSSNTPEIFSFHWNLRRFFALMYFSLAQL
jgi:E3 ubiquitin-protein ligase UBR2